MSEKRPYTQRKSNILRREECSEVVIHKGKAVQRMTVYLEERKNGFIKNGLCGKCGKNPKREDADNCIRCTAITKGRASKRKADGLCFRCPERARANSTMCAQHLKELADKQKAINHKNRDTVLRHYGSVCACCKEHIQDFLTIDHVNNDGNKHRRRFLKDYNIKLSGPRMYVWLIKEGLPVGFQILCFNCNFSKHLNKGKCIHQIQIETKTYTAEASH